MKIYEYPNSRYVANFIGDMNIFDGTVKAKESDHLLISSEDIGCNIYISYGGDFPIGSSVGIAIRPEKIIITKNAIKSKYNVTQGIVSEIAYLGDVSIYHIILKSGKKILASVINKERHSESPINWDEEVYIQWNADSGVVISD